MIRFRRFFSGMLVCLLLLILLAGCEQDSISASLTVDLLKVGKADAIVLITGDRCMIIDAGEEDDGPEMIRFLQSRGIRRLDTLIITHFDKDHVGGAAALLGAYSVDRILLPAYENELAEYQAFLAAIDRQSTVPERLSDAVTFSFGDAEVLVEPPLSYEATTDGEADNNFSLITTVTHGENQLVFAGDSEKSRIRDWLKSREIAPCDFLKLPHHGVFNKALDELLDALQPSYVAICTSDKNPAEDKTLSLLAERGITTFETKDGDITILSDGQTLRVSQSNGF
ncbi:MAG: MBL fold metallo-hydrolase [Clostridia bacterium]|nr:MBL fold metallo-hydrolase [Clostridia bacterium]